MKITKATKITALFAVPLLIGGYFIYRQFSGKKTYDNAVKPPAPPKTGGAAPAPTAYSKYIVDTLLTNLNVRDTPSTSGAKVGSLAKGTEIFAKPSSTAGWFEYSANGTTSSGFVSASYLKAK